MIANLEKQVLDKIAQAHKKRTNKPTIHELILMQQNVPTEKMEQ
jgi:hypothetical protein